MYQCKFCPRTFEIIHARSAHQKWCDPEKNYSFSGPNNPRWGKKGNQNTNKNWDEVPFEKLGRDKRRERLLKEANNSCTMCNFSQTRKDGTSILQIDHIDGNKKNNCRKNLQVLCPNCHAVHTEKFMFIGQKHSSQTLEKRKTNRLLKLSINVQNK